MIGNYKLKASIFSRKQVTFSHKEKKKLLNSHDLRCILTLDSATPNRSKRNDKIEKFNSIFFQIIAQISNVKQLNQFSEIKSRLNSKMNYYYDYYNYFPDPSQIYPFHGNIPNPFQQKFETKIKVQIKEETDHNCKIEGPEPDHIQTKVELQLPFLQQAPKRRAEGKKGQSDAFTQKRNIVPNNINHILAFVQRKSKSEKYVKILIKKYKGLDCFTPKRFYCYQQLIKEKLHVHVNRQSLDKVFVHLDQRSQIFPLQEQVFYNRICRVLIFFYLRDVAKITILGSGRVKQTSKADHLRAQRQLIHYVSNFNYSP